MIDNKLAIAGELTWQEVVESIVWLLDEQGERASTLRRASQVAAVEAEILFFWGAYRLRSLLGLP